MQEIFNQIIQLGSSQRVCVLATVVSSVGSSPRKVCAKMLILGDGSIQGTIGGGALEKKVISDALRVLRRGFSELKTYPLDERSGLQVCGGKVSIFLDLIKPQRELVIAGAGHIGLALSLVAKLLGYSVTIVDERKDFANKKRFPHVDRIVCGPFGRSLDRSIRSAECAVVIVTVGHKGDEICLERSLRRGAAYIGMIGSKAKIAKIFSSLRKKGFSGSELKKVYSPIGLDIGAQTPEEIAVSIAAELIREHRYSKREA